LLLLFYGSAVPDLLLTNEMSALSETEPNYGGSTVTEAFRITVTSPESMRPLVLTP
jgi:hypothetical protein